MADAIGHGATTAYLYSRARGCIRAARAELGTAYTCGPMHRGERGERFLIAIHRLNEAAKWRDAARDRRKRGGL